MKLIHVLWRWRSWVLLTIGVTLVGWPLPGAGVAQQVAEQPKERLTPPVPGPVPNPRAQQEVESIPLKYAKARDLAGIIQQMFPGRVFGGLGHDFRFTIDDRTNSVLLVGDPEDIALAKSLLSKLDVPPASSQATVSTSVYHLQYTKADNNLRNALSLVLGGEGHFVLDPTANAIIVTGDQKKQQEAANLLGRLDRPQPNKANLAGEMQVRVVWLASGLKEGEGRKPPADLKDVIQELTKMGVEDPRLVTQTLVTALPENHHFGVEGRAGNDSKYRFSVTGSLLPKTGEAGRLIITINATQAGTNNTIGRVDTEIMAPLGHWVVLGMTPTANTTSVFVVQILPRK